MSDRRVELLRRLADSTTYEGERDAALAKAAELEARAASPPSEPPPSRPPAAGAADWPWPQGGFSVTYTANSGNVTIRFR